MKKIWYGIILFVLSIILLVIGLILIEIDFIQNRLFVSIIFTIFTITGFIGICLIICYSDK